MIKTNTKNFIQKTFIFAFNLKYNNLKTHKNDKICSYKVSLRCNYISTSYILTK